VEEEHGLAGGATGGTCPPSQAARYAYRSGLEAIPQEVLRDDRELRPDSERLLGIGQTCSFPPLRQRISPRTEIPNQLDQPLSENRTT
jgi:hypothetical protein